jgi:aminopeptidase YwaD
MKTHHILFILALLITGCRGIPENPDITENELFQHLSYLASDSLKGRLPGTEEGKLAALYIASEFRKAGLSFLTRNGFQPFDVITKLETGDSNSLSIGSREYELGKDFSPFPFTADGSLDAEVVFAGYGFDLDNDGLKWNDYDGLDVGGKWVLVLRGNPEIDSASSPFNAYSNERDKAMVANDHGAGGILFVSGPVFSPDEPLIDLENREGRVAIPALHISRKVADRLLEQSGSNVEKLEKRLNAQRKPSSFATGSSLRASAGIIPSMASTYNVVGYLEGSDPEKKDEYIIMGAHYDHLGMGGPGSTARDQDTIGVHNGADDNASGVAALIEIAERLASGEKKPGCSYLFIAFSGEEMGLLGSKYYVQHPLLPLDHAKMMINLDMVGRLRDDQLQVGGVGTSKESEELVEDLAPEENLKLSTTREGYGPSDHSSFYGRDIPVLFLTTGAHTDYHTINDDVDKINLGGLVRVSDFAYDIAEYLDSTDLKLTFQEAGPKTQYSGRRGYRVVMGIMPDFTDNDDVPGMRVDFVNPGQPADLGGMKKGDYIMAIEGKEIKGIYDYMYRLNKCKKGQVIVVKVKRDDKLLDLIVTL